MTDENKTVDLSRMTLPFEMHSNTGVLTLPFENLDDETSRTLKLNLNIAMPACKILILDLEQVKFMDSSGIGIILTSQREMNKKRGDLKLCSLSKPVRALLEMVRMNKALDIYSNLQEALTAVNQS
ncbi:MAG: STAS domain-containing protein [Candidatus Riflebacteria bacterium]|nr:STAS domain-containing protein [Candidatus Riflebacteria bacterium]